MSLNTSPNQSLYIKNLNDKINKEDLRVSLYMLFSIYGPVLDIVALKTPKMRGQAHVVFCDVSSAASAMRALQGAFIFGKPMAIQYARSKSDSVAKLDGTFKIPSYTSAAVNPATAHTQGIKRGRDESDEEDAPSTNKVQAVETETDQ